MIESLLVAVAIIGALIWYIKRVRAKNKRLEGEINRARRVTDYREAESDYTRERLQNRDERVNEQVEISQNEDYSDLFGPDGDQ